MPCPASPCTQPIQHTGSGESSDMFSVASVSLAPSKLQPCSRSPLICIPLAIYESNEQARDIVSIGYRSFLDVICRRALRNVPGWKRSPNERASEKRDFFLRFYTHVLRALLRAISPRTQRIGLSGPSHMYVQLSGTAPRINANESSWI